MRKTLTAVTLAAALAVSGATAVMAKDASPVFGSAKAQTLSKAENQKVVGKGYYADLFGSYGDYYAYSALSNSYYGYIYSSYSLESYYYGAAYNDAYNAYIYYYYAYYYAGS